MNLNGLILIILSTMATPAYLFSGDDKPSELQQTECLSLQLLLDVLPSLTIVYIQLNQSKIQIIHLF